MEIADDRGFAQFWHWNCECNCEMRQSKWITSSSINYSGKKVLREGAGDEGWAKPRVRLIRREQEKKWEISDFSVCAD
jgi:hypothetical protein